MTGQFCVYGVVSSRQEDESHVSYTIEYDETSRRTMNSVSNGCGVSISKFQKGVLPQLVLGGRVRFLEGSEGSRARNSHPFHLTWINPSFRHDDFVEENGQRLPRLTILVRGFQVVFVVKPSGIHGKGVFVSCSRADGSQKQEPLKLLPGELIDLGVYAPLRPEDTKTKSTFQVKNFLFQQQCEQWGFVPLDPAQHFDITDDATGELHDKAKNLVFPYVNESRDESKICITAEHDPENSVHYLLGHSQESQGPFILPCEQEVIEALIDYGPQYEHERVRKGYSSLPLSDREELKKQLENDDLVDVANMDGFDASEIQGAVDFLFRLFTGDRTLTDTVCNRALLCAAVLWRRAWKMLLKYPSDSRLTEMHKHSSVLVSLILKRVARSDKAELEALYRGSTERFLQHLLRADYTDEQLAEELADTDIMN